MSIWIDWDANMVLQNVHRWNIRSVQYGNDKKGSYHMEKVESRFKCIDTWWVNQDSSVLTLGE